jgi:MFS family permease
MESGFFPGVVYLISCWYKPAEIGTRFAIFYSASVMAGAFGGLMAGVTQSLEGVGGLTSWRWLFIIEGTVTICVALIAKFILLDFPGTSAALTPEERHLAKIRLLPPGMDEAEADHELTHAQAFKAVICDYRTFLFMFLSVCIIGAGTITYFVPTIIVTLGYDHLTAQYMTMPIYVSAASVLIMTAISADRRQERRWHITASLSMGFVAAIICMLSTNAALRYITLCFVVAGIWTSIPLSLAWTGEVINMPAEKRAVCFALVNSVANISCIFGSQLWPASTAPHYTFGFGFTAAYLACGAVAAAVIPVFLNNFPYYMTDAERDIEERKDMKASDVFFVGV